MEKKIEQILSGPVLLMLKKCLQKLLPTQKNHAQLKIKGEKKKSCPRNLPNPPTSPLKN